MKKWMALICMIACIFGLTACGNEETLTDYEQYKVENAKQIAEEYLVPLLMQYMDDVRVHDLDEYTSEEIEYMLENQVGLLVDGNALKSAINSFYSAMSSMGAIKEVVGSTTTVSGDTIIVEVEVVGEKKNATAEIILSNDMFWKMQSAALNPKASMGELMGRAALNTLIGMGTVFAVLILISFIISGFRLISKAQDNAAKKKAANLKDGGVTGVENAVAQIEEQEAAAEDADDLELAAVIAAAVAAYEGGKSADGFVVRSIRKRA